MNPEVIIPAFDDFLAERSVSFECVAIGASVLGRLDLLRSKLFALCDRGIDIPDCLALAPTEEEIGEITPWLEERDSNPDWPEHVRDVLRDLRERLGYGI